MVVLGISAYYHDSAVALIKDGKVIFAIEEERLSRIKHDNSFPKLALARCLIETKLNVEDIDIVAYYEKPLLKFERIIQTFTETYPKSFNPFYKSIPEQLSQKIKVESSIRRELKYTKKIVFVPHHLSHASASYFTSGFTKSPILTIDGVGEYMTTGLWQADGNKITLLKSLNFPHSLGLLYSTFTAFLGFRVNEDEYKVMGLSAFGKPTCLEQIYKIVILNKDGSFSLNMDYFNFRDGFQMWNKNFESIFGRPRSSSEEILKRHKDIAASIQFFTEQVYFKLLNHLSELVPSKHVCIAGGVALNALANGKIYKNTPFEKVFIFGPSGDSGAAIGAALYTFHEFNKSSFVPKQYVSLRFGTEYSNSEVEQILKEKNLDYSYYHNKLSLIKQVAKLLNQDIIVGWFNGKMEFGPRALGNRSILANPKNKSMKIKVNEIKNREQFRPFAGAVLEEFANKYFELPAKKYSAPFMNFCFPVRTEKQSLISAIIHKDKTCRIQTISNADGDFYYLLKEFAKLSGGACLLNTSFNIAGDPIVENVNQATSVLVNSKLKYLVIGNYLICKSIA